jgi:hypothetical protein
MEVKAVPLVIQSHLRKVARIAALTCVAVFGFTGAAFASCPSQPVSTPFSHWGDTNNYFLVPGGSFEGTADDVGWDLHNASLTAGNEPFNVNGPNDAASLTIGAGGTATSPYFCVDNTMQSLRFIAQQVDPGSDLQVVALVKTWSGPHAVPVGDLADGSITSWAPTDPMDGGAGQLPTNRTIQVALQFSVPGGSGSWQLDEVFVDPYRSG